MILFHFLSSRERGDGRKMDGKGERRTRRPSMMSYLRTLDAAVRFVVVN